MLEQMPAAGFHRSARGDDIVNKQNVLTLNLIR